MSDRITRISSSGHGIGYAIRELFQNSDILRAFTMRDLRIRYAQTYLGFTWSILQPILGLAAVFVLFFKIAGINSVGVPYLVFALSGLIFWNYFYFLVTQTASSFVNSQAMIKKIYFPRLSLPFSKAFVGLVDFAVGMVLLFAMMMYYHITVIGLLAVPLILIMVLLSGLGLGLIVSGLSLRYRDLQQVLPFALQLLFFLTPVAYPSSLFTSFIGEEYLWVTYLNPMTGILELFRHFLFDYPLSSHYMISLAVSVFLFILGLSLFSRIDKKMADLI